MIGAVEAGRARLDFPLGSLWGLAPGAAPRIGAAATAIIRIERTRLADGPGDNRLPLALRTSLYLGERWEYLLTGGALSMRAWGHVPESPGDRWLELPADRVWIFADAWPGPSRTGGSSSRG